jgi:iron complex outermembrane receptor protein
MQIRCFTIIAVTALLQAFVSNARAQVPQGSEQKPDEEMSLATIVVTAQRREERLQDVPITVAAIPASALSSRGIDSTTDLQQTVPGLVFQKASTAVEPYLRGVGTAVYAAGADPSVSVYVDGAYLSSAQALLFSFNDIERIEVLYGPQGTLFGRNATGGLVQIITKDPTQDFHATASVEYGNFNKVVTKDYVSGGSEKVAAELAVYYSDQSGGWGHNLYQPPAGYVPGVTGPAVLPRTEIGILSELGLHAKVLFQTDNGTKVKLSWMYSKSKGDQGEYFSTGYNGTFASGVGGAPFTHPGGFYNIDSDTDFYAHQDQSLFIAEVAHDANFATLKSISSYLLASEYFQLPSDGTPAYVGTSNSFSHYNTNTFTQELQILSNDNLGPRWLHWIAGLYYLNGRGEQDPTYTGLTSNQGNGLPLFNTARYNGENNQSQAAYAQATANLTASTNLTLGVRYTQDQVTGYQYWIGQNPLPAAVGTANQSGYVTRLVPPTKADFSKTTFRAAVDQHLNDSVMLFASFNTGYKAGVWNNGNLCALPGGPNPPGSCLTVQAPVAPETLKAYEAGVKSEFLDHRLQLNVSGFYYDYTNLQVQAVVGIPPTGILANAATAKVKGADLTGDAKLTRDLTVNFSAEYLDARYKSFPGATYYFPRAVAPYGNSTAVADASGNYLGQAPKISVTAGFDWRIPSSIGSFDLNVSSFYTAKVYWDPQNRLVQGAYDLLNAQLGYEVNKTWRVRVYGRNLLDREHCVLQAATAFGDYCAPAAPRTFGGGFQASF